MDTAHRLDEFVADHTDASYRGAMYYDAEGWEILDIRSEPDVEDLGSALKEFHGRLLEHRGLGREDGSLGRHRATVEVYENGLLLHFPLGSDAGVVLTFDRSEIEDLARLVSECDAFLHGER